MQTSQFLKGKGQIIEEFQRSRKKILSTVAGRNFSFEPGFVFDIANELETDTKFKLSDLNYQILETMVNLDLKQKGVAYDISYKNASAAWEIEKAGLLSDLQREIALLNSQRDLEKEDLQVLFIELARRGIFLLEQQTDIELEKEALRLQLESIEDTATEYEIELAKAKKASAEERLKIIPILSQIVAIEQNILLKEQNISNLTQMLFDKEKEVQIRVQALVSKMFEVQRKEVELLPKEQEIQAKMEQLVSKMFEVISASELLNGAFRRIVDQEVILAGKREQEAEKSLLLSDKRIEEALQRPYIIAAKESILDSERVIINNKSSVINENIANISSIGESLLLLSDVIGKEQEITAKESEIIEQKRLLIEQEQPILEREGELLELLNESVEKEREILEKQGEVIQQEIELIMDYDALIDIEQQIQGLTDEISLIYVDITGIVRQVIERSADVISITESLFNSKELTAASYNQVLDNQHLKLEAEEELIDAETGLINYSINRLYPVISNLTNTIYSYISSLDRQSSIQNQIISTELQTAGAMQQKAAAQQQTLTQKQSLVGATQSLVSAIQTSITNKITQLSTLYTELENAITEYTTSKETQAGYEGDIIEIKKEIAEILKETNTNEIKLIEAEIKKLNSDLKVKTQNRLLEQQLIEHKSDMFEVKIDNFKNYKTAWDTSNDLINTTRELTYTTTSNNRRLTLLSDFDMQISNNMQRAQASEDASDTKNQSSLGRIKDETNAQVEFKGVTAKLTHLFKQS